MDVSRIPTYGPEGSVNVLVEIPRGSRNKYEYDETLGVMRLDRTLYAAVHYPTDYGFVPGTRGRDGDPVDALVLVEEPAFPGCLVRVRLVAVLTITHSKGPEQKLLGIPISEPRFAAYQDVDDVPAHLLREIEHFFDVFKELEGSDIHALGWEGAAEARATVARAIERASET